VTNYEKGYLDGSRGCRMKDEDPRYPESYQDYMRGYKVGCQYEHIEEAIDSDRTAPALAAQAMGRC
jgi:hypothetical protein